jgi:putative heme-binding domain-containing protein
MRNFGAFFVTIAVFAQAGRAPGPTRQDLAQGRAVYLSNCSFCHGAGGEGGRGPNIASAATAASRTDAQLRRVIKQGVPGSQMPAFSYLEETELRQLVAFVRSMPARGGTAEKPAGDTMRGKALYAKHRCSMCHRIGDEGSVYGPDLSRIGAGRPLAYLAESIVEPGKDILPEYRGVKVVTKDGAAVAGVRVNEDTFTVQLRDIGQRFRMFDKQQAASVEEMKESLMPAYRLSKGELDDLVAYLYSLRGDSRASGAARTAGGIR